MKISAHVLVKNEERFVWFAVMSVINYVDEVFVWDNGSSDKTSKIVSLIKSPKVKFRKVPEMSLQKAREEMIHETKADWIFILDGDEIWHDSSIFEIRNGIEKSGDNKDCIVVPNYMLVGDIYHFQEREAGRYNVAGRRGHYNIRAVRNTKGLHVEGVYGNEAFVTKEGIKVQDLPENRILMLNSPYLHASFLKRKKFEIGDGFPSDFYYPEVFFRSRPEIVPSPWGSMSGNFKFLSFVETPFRKIYRRTFLSFKKHGY